MGRRATPGERVKIETTLADDRGSTVSRGESGRAIEPPRRSHDGQIVQVVRFGDGRVAEVPVSAMRPKGK